MTPPEVVNKRVLVTGGRGFVGQAIVDALLCSGYEVVVISRRNRPERERAGLTYVQADLLTLDIATARAMLLEHAVDIVVHCAGELNNEGLMYDLHVRATGRLVEASRGIIRHWVQMSSVGALGSGLAGPVSPDRRTQPVGVYEQTKAESDRVVTETLKGSGSSVAVIMPTIVFGPGMSSTSLRRLVSAIRSRRFVHVGPATAGAHYLYITDLADAVLRAVETLAVGTYVISDSTTVGQLVSAIAIETGSPTPTRRVPEPVMRVLQSRVVAGLPVPGMDAIRALRSLATYTSEPAERHLRWTPGTGWRAGLARCLTDWSSDPSIDGDRPIRIAYLTTVPMTMHFFRGHIQHERRVGSEIVVISDPAGHSLHDTAAKLGVRGVAVDMTRDISLIADVRALISLTRVLRSTRPHVLQTATPKAALLGALAGTCAKVPVIVTGVFGLPQMTRTGWRKALLNATTRLSTYLGDITWCDSPSMAAHVRAGKLAPPRRVVVVGEGSVSGVDSSSEFNPHLLAASGQRIRNQLGIDQAARVIGYVGRLAHDKGMTELALAWEVWRGRHPDAHLLVVGPDDGDLGGAARQLLAEGERMHWVGSRHPVGPWFAAMDVFVMPSYREGFCATNLEASAMELPVVATRIPGCVDSVVDGITGTLVPAHDPDALADAVSRYMDNPERRAEHGRAGRTRAIAHFSPDKMERGLARLYRRQLKGRP